MTGPHFTPIDLALTRVIKTYPGAVALDDVSLSIRGGEVVGLIGENGAGKSTLLKILAGAEAPSAGAISVDGKVYDRLTPASAIQHGIALVHQELKLVSQSRRRGEHLAGAGDHPRSLWIAGPDGNGSGGQAHIGGGWGTFRAARFRRGLVTRRAAACGNLSRSCSTGQAPGPRRTDLKPDTC